MLTVQDLLEQHEIIINASGGSHGVRDIGILEAALGRANQSAFGVDIHPTIFDKSASLLEAIALHHPFIDGNKRTALAAAALYLATARQPIALTDDEYEDFMLHVVLHRPSVQEIAVWLKEHAA